MKTYLGRTALVCLALALSTPVALAAQGSPIGGVAIGLENDSGSMDVARDVTDREGRVRFGKVAPGNYVVVIDGKSLDRAINKLDPKRVPHTVRVVIGSPDQKSIVSNEPYRGGSAGQAMRIRYTVPSSPGEAIGRYIFMGVTLDF